MLPARGVLAGLLAASAAMLTLTDAADLPADGWYPCPTQTFADISTAFTSDAARPKAQCRLFKAPLCYKGICKDDREIEIFAKRITATVDGKPNVIFMQGGPGAASPALESGMLSLFKLLDGNANVYTMDHRGTGRSTKLECVATQALTSGSPGQASVDPEEVASCATELEERYGNGNLAGFSITSAASDINLFITKYLPKSTTYVYGVSYGTKLVERLMHLETPEIAGYILDGVATTPGASTEQTLYMSKWDVSMDAVGEQFMSYCDKNETTCGKYFKGSTLSKTLKSVLTKLDDPAFACNKALAEVLASNETSSKQTAKPTTVSQGLRSLFGGLLQAAPMRTLIPPLVYRINRCNDDDQRVLPIAMKAVKELSESGEKSEDMSYMSDLIYKLIVFSELWEPAVTGEELATRFTNASIALNVGQFLFPAYCAFTKDTSESCSEYRQFASYNASAITYKKDAYANETASLPKNVSVLVLSGKLDPQTPHKYAEVLYDLLKTENKKMVAFESGAHAVAFSTVVEGDEVACGMRVLASYIENAGDVSKLTRRAWPRWRRWTWPSRRPFSWCSMAQRHSATVTEAAGRAGPQSSDLRVGASTAPIQRGLVPDLRWSPGLPLGVCSDRSFGSAHK